MTDESDIAGREDWEKGPWDDEPDEKYWSKWGYPCVIRRNPTMGNLCGYVVVPINHPWCELPLDHEVFEDVNVHGGVTYSAKGRPANPPGDFGWTVGFDCAHAGDHAPGLRAIVRGARGAGAGSALALLGELFPPREVVWDTRDNPSPLATERYRDIGYVTEQVNLLAGYARDAMEEKS